MNNQDTWEEEMEKVIREKGKESEVPESLQPDQVRERLNQKKIVTARRRKNNIGRFCAAAVLLMVCGTGIWMRSGDHSLPGSGNRSSGEGSYNTSVESEKTNDSTKDTAEKLSYAKSYKEIRKIRKEITERVENKMVAKSAIDYEADFYAMAEDIDGSASGNSASMEQNVDENAAISESEYSQTNVSVEGIAEADLVHTDGEYIYRLRDSGAGGIYAILDIIRADGGEMERIGTYHCRKEDSAGEDLSPQEFFLADDQLILLSNAYQEDTCNTRITFIDISNRKAPVKKGELTQSGSYEQARIRDGYLYTVSGSGWGRYGCCDVIEDQGDEIPHVDGKRIAPSKIYIPDGCDTTEFTTITSVRIADGTKFTDSRSIMAEAKYLHMTENSIYFVGDRWKGWEEKNWRSLKKKQISATQITRFVYQKGIFTGKASAQVAGSIKDDFAINEYNGTLRVISSIEYNRGKDDNAVFVLDEDLNVIGSIENLAKGERVYSARFQGDIGYFVTYRETDPLFSVDFSDPRYPKLLGELKIPGFSEYMHFYNDHLLFGLGLEEGKNDEDSIKLSMFDISDPQNVREIHKILLKDVSYSEALYNYKSVLIDPKKNIIGFGGCSVSRTKGMPYYIYSYDEQKGFVCRVDSSAEVSKEREEQNEIVELSRGIYIGDTVYMLDLYSGAIWAYDFNSGKCIGKYRNE